MQGGCGDALNQRENQCPQFVESRRKLIEKSPGAREGKAGARALDGDRRVRVPADRGGLRGRESPPRAAEFRRYAVVAQPPGDDLEQAAGDCAGLGREADGFTERLCD